MKKFLLGLDCHIDIFDSWVNANSDFLNQEGYVFDCPIYESDFHQLVKMFEPSDELDKLLRGGKGRNRVVMHALSQIANHQNDVGDCQRSLLNSFSNGLDMRVLGSLIKRAVRTYRDVNSSNLAFLFPRDPHVTYQSIDDMHSKFLKKRALQSGGLEDTLPSGFPVFDKRGEARFG